MIFTKVQKSLLSFLARLYLADEISFHQLNDWHDAITGAICTRELIKVHRTIVKWLGDETSWHECAS